MVNDKEREAFESTFKKPPYEWSFKIHDEKSPWAGNYYGFNIQCAWEGWQAKIAHTNNQSIHNDNSAVNDALDKAAKSIDDFASSGENKDEWTITRDLALHRAAEIVRGLIEPPPGQSKSVLKPIAVQSEKD